MNFDEKAKKYVSVSQLNEYVKMLMDSDGFLNAVAVRGEISNFKRHYSGHLYFSMKDAEGTLRCVMFASSASGLNFIPKDGSDVIAYGRVSVFPRDGSYQLYVTAMQDAGLGDIYAAFEKLKTKLSAEGLFDQSRKKPIPKFPRKIGIVTSATGAAVRDLFNILGRRYPLAEIILYPALVQGSSAAASVAEGIRYFNREKTVDVIIAGRGGGSFEDLNCFNDETLARTIAVSCIPIISAVGHETDFTIADFVADLRAPTPSAAAELAVPDGQELIKRLENAEQRMTSAIVSRLDIYKKQLDRYASSSVLASPERVIDAYDERLLAMSRNMDYAINSMLDRNDKKLAALCAGLEALSPLKVLSRGYTMVRKDGDVLTSSTQLKADDRITLGFRDGTAEAVVNRVESKGKTEV